MTTPQEPPAIAPRATDSPRVPASAHPACREAGCVLSSGACVKIGCAALRLETPEEKQTVNADDYELLPDVGLGDDNCFPSEVQVLADIQAAMRQLGLLAPEEQPA